MQNDTSTWGRGDMVQWTSVVKNREQPHSSAWRSEIKQDLRWRGNERDDPTPTAALFSPEAVGEFVFCPSHPWLLLHFPNNRHVQCKNSGGGTSAHYCLTTLTPFLWTDRLQLARVDPDFNSISSRLETWLESLMFWWASQLVCRVQTLQTADRVTIGSVTENCVVWTRHDFIHWCYVAWNLQNKVGRWFCWDLVCLFQSAIYLLYSCGGSRLSKVVQMSQQFAAPLGEIQRHSQARWDIQYNLSPVFSESTQLKAPRRYPDQKCVANRIYFICPHIV